MGRCTNRFKETTKLTFRSNKINELLDETRLESYTLLQGQNCITLSAAADNKIGQIRKICELVSNLH